MNELINNFINQIEDVNKLKEISVEEFTKLVKSNNLISESEAKQLIESFKTILNKKNSEDESSESDQRKKKYRLQQHGGKQTVISEKEKIIKDKDEDSLER